MWRIFVAIATIAMAIEWVAADGWNPPKRGSLSTGYQKLDDYNFAAFFQQFGTTIAHLLGSDYNATKAEAEALKKEMATCKELITAKQAVCKTDAKNACEPGLDDIILYYLDEAAAPFVDMAEKLSNESAWGQAWQKLATFYGGLGSDFIGMEGWGDMADFFTNLKDGFVSWGGWDDAGDFFSSLGSGFLSGMNDFFNMDFTFNLRRKRALELKERAAGDQLVHFIRALAEMTERKTNYNRELSSEARACMEKCDSCKAFLQDSEYMITTICGAELLQRNMTFFATLANLNMVYSLLTEKDNPIITSLQYDPTSFSMTIMGYSRVELWANFAAGYDVFKPSEGYRMMAMPRSAALMAKEYYDTLVQ